MYAFVYVYENFSYVYDDMYVIVRLSISQLMTYKQLNVMEKSPSTTSKSPSTSDNWLYEVFYALGDGIGYFIQRLENLPNCIRDTCKAKADEAFSHESEALMKDF